MTTHNSAPRPPSAQEIAKNITTELVRDFNAGHTMLEEYLSGPAPLETKQAVYEKLREELINRGGIVIETGGMSLIMRTVEKYQIHS